MQPAPVVLVVGVVVWWGRVVFPNGVSWWVRGVLVRYGLGFGRGL